MRFSAYKSYLLSVLLAVLVFNYVDRTALSVTLQSIKLEFGLSDLQVGLLTGIAFAFFYSVMGMPIARWADRGNRVAIITWTTALWSVAVAMCGIAGNFLQLMLIRVGVAVGEAGCIPPAHSLIADYFPRTERPRAAAIYMLGIPLSMVVGFFAAGWLNELYGWRVTFVLVGLPGVVLAPVAWLTLSEPRRTGRSVTAGAGLGSRESRGVTPPVAVPGFFKVLRTLWGNRTFRQILFAYSILSFSGQGVAQWKPAFFIRSFGMQTGDLGTWLAAIYAVSGLLGTYGGGRLASRYAAANERLQLRAMAVAYSSNGLISAFMYFSPNQYIAFAFMAVALLGGHMAVGPMFATIQTLVPERMRAMSIAIVFLCANLIGMGLGPVATGALSDALHPLLGEESLRYALLAMCPASFWGGWHLWRASKSVADDIELLQGRAQPEGARGECSELQIGSEPKLGHWEARRL